MSRKQPKSLSLYTKIEGVPVEDIADEAAPTAPAKAKRAAKATKPAASNKQIEQLNAYAKVLGQEIAWFKKLQQRSEEAYTKIDITQRPAALVSAGAKVRQRLLCINAMTDELDLVKEQLRVRAVNAKAKA